MTFLLVEDDLDDVELFVDALKTIAEPVTLVIAHNGVEALGILATLQNPPDHIFLDINMPVMDGLECFRAIRRDLRLNVPVTILSTKHNDESNALCDELEADCVEKPTAWLALVLVIQTKVNETIRRRKDGSIL
jgi:CheY-like chemotaxis protein